MGNLQEQPIAGRRSMLARLVVSLVNKQGPLTKEERQRLSQYHQEMQDLEGPIGSEADQKYSSAFRSYLRFGLEPTQFQRGISADERAVIFQTQTRELRDMGVGLEGGAYPGSAGGYFAPLDFAGQVESALKDYGPMLDPDFTTIVDTATGAPRNFPSDDDATVSGIQVAEGAQTQEEDIGTVSQVSLSSFKFSSGIIKVSMELAQDAGFPLEAYLADRFAIRIARVANVALTTGSGASGPTGLITTATVGLTAVGAFPNDGVSAANTIGSDDLINLELQVDPLYRIGAAYMMHANTLAALRKLKDKEARPIYALHDSQKINGYPVVTNPAMAQLQTEASSPQVTHATVAFGNLKKYVIRRTRLTVNRLEQRFADYGQVAYLAMQRIDGNLLDGGGGAVKVLQNVY